MGVGGGFCCSVPQYGRGQGESGGTHTHTHTHTQEHTGTYTRMLHLPFSDLPLKKCPILQYSLTGKDGSGSGFGSWKTVPAVPVPLSVSGKTVPTVPVSGSGSVPEPP